jgi:site-specific recombinase XerD
MTGIIIPSAGLFRVVLKEPANCWVFSGVSPFELGIILVSFLLNSQPKERTFMIDQFYSPGVKLGHLRCGALASHIDGFADHLSSQGYTNQTARLKIRLAADLSAWLSRRHLRANDVEDEQVDLFLKARRKNLSLQRGDGLSLIQLIHYLREVGAISVPCMAICDSPTDRLIRAYAGFLVEQRGLCQSTLGTYLPIVRHFLEVRFGVGKLALNKLDVSDITDFIFQSSSTGSLKRVQLSASAVRSFLGFLAQEGKVTTNLAASVPTVANWRLAELPQFLEPAQVEKLLRSCNQKTQTGRRDYAVLLLLARLGLRAGEVVHLTLESINWEAGEILIRGKSAREDRLPLPPDVGRALAAYLKQDRPTCSCRRVFIRMMAPRQGFSNSVAVCDIVRRALTRAGLHPQQKGAHLLRRSLATKMLRQGVSLAQIGEVLRHQMVQTTQIYAKVDLVALRALALPWLGGVQ